MHDTITITLRQLLGLFALLLFATVGLVACSEVVMNYRLSPPADLREFLAGRNPPPAPVERIYSFEEDGKTVIAIECRVVPSFYAPLHMPSSGPMYFYDAQGKLLDWTSDAGVGGSRHHAKEGSKVSLTAPEALELVEAKAAAAGKDKM
ncbi:MAG TPA: hypothetical protein VK970_00480 [Candidatus Methylacidiphilales bacterium]|nr:hypothetical protein [Candidatus Methylacidiphilales bacterium]